MFTLDRGFRRIGCFAILLLALSVMTPGRALADTGSDVAQLQALLEAQQARMDALQEQLAASRSQGAEGARNEALRNQIRQILGEQEFRESLMPSMLQAGYDNGFFIRSSDDKFLMKFNGRMQFRFTHYAKQSRNRYLSPRLRGHDMTGFDVRRFRFHISGHVYDPNLTYLIKLDADSPSGYDVGIRYAYVNYRFADEFQIRAGAFQLAATRAGFASSGNMQFCEYPETAAVFDPFEGVGVRFWGQLFEKRVEYFLDIANSFNGMRNRTITTDENRELDGNPAVAFRTVWHVCGENPTKDFVSWADIDHLETPAFDLGFHYLFDDNYGDATSSRIVFARPKLFGGGFGVTTSEGVQINQFGFDAAFKWQGFSATGEYIFRIIDPRRAGRTPFTPLWLLTADDSTTVNHGAYVQMGYFLPIPGMERKLEAVARIGGIAANPGPGGSEGTWFYTAGLNYYFEGNKVKLQTDFTKIPKVPLAANSWLANANDNALIWRVQLQVAF